MANWLFFGAVLCDVYIVVGISYMVYDMWYMVCGGLSLLVARHLSLRYRCAVCGRWAKAGFRIRESEEQVSGARCQGLGAWGGGKHNPAKLFFSIPNSLFPTPYSLFPIPNSLFPIPYSQLLI